MLDLPQRRAGVREQLDDARAEHPQERVDDVPAVVERGAASLAAPGAVPALVVALGTEPVQLDPGARDLPQQALLDGTAGEGDPARVPRPALGVELHARATDRVRHCRGVGNARGHRALGEDVSAGLGRGDGRLGAYRRSRQQHHRLDLLVSEKAFVVAVDADARDGRRLSQCGLSQLLGAGLVVARLAGPQPRRVRRCMVRLDLPGTAVLRALRLRVGNGHDAGDIGQPGVDVGVQAGDGSAAGEGNTDSVVGHVNLFSDRVSGSRSDATCRWCMMLNTG